MNKQQLGKIWILLSILILSLSSVNAFSKTLIFEDNFDTTWDASKWVTSDDGKSNASVNAGIAYIDHDTASSKSHLLTNPINDFNISEGWHLSYKFIFPSLEIVCINVPVE